MQDATGYLRDGDNRIIYNLSGGQFPGYFKFLVPDAQGGKAWKFNGCGGSPFLMTVPPSVSRSPDELLIPEELLEKESSIKRKIK